MKDQAEQMGEKPILRLLIKFSLPSMVGMIIQAVYYTVDRIFIGQSVGSLGIAATTITSPIMMMGFALAMLISVGGSALASIRLGEQKMQDAEKVLGTAFILLAIAGVLLTGLGQIFLRPLLVLIGASEGILPFAMAYMRLYLVGLAFMPIVFGLNNFVRAEGNPRLAMVYMVVGAILNIILDYVLIIELNMGMRGAGLASVLAQAVSSALVLHYYFGGSSLLKIRRANFRPEWPIIGRILAIGAAPFAMMVIDSVMIVVWNLQLGIYGGDLSISVMGILSSISMFLGMPVFGLSQGAQPLFGYNYGAVKLARVKKILLLTALNATLVTVIGFLVAFLFPSQLITIFNRSDSSLIEAGVPAMRIYFAAMPLMGFMIVVSNYFQAVGKARSAMILILVRTVLLQAPAILVFPLFFGLTGIWMSSPISMFGASLVTGIWLWFENRELNRRLMVEREQITAHTERT